MVGSVAARQLADHFGDLRSLLEARADTLRSDLAAMHGIGPKLADSVAAYLESPHGHQVLQKLVALNVRSLASVTRRAQTGPLQGRSVCVTGTLSRPRERIHAEILAAGGELHERVRKGTTYLVAGAKVGESKLAAAVKHGAKVIDEAELSGLLGLETGQHELEP